MREEYTGDNYPSFGKKYNGERAIISLTSWRARINTVSKTLYSLIKQCPGFHIVLVLSEEEFPKMMDELPANLKLFVDNEIIEVLWVYKNYKAFKKVLFTMDKYRDVPVISADDDCIYTCNYAEDLYQKWDCQEDKRCFIKYDYNKEYPDPYLPQGPTTLYYGFSDKAMDIIRSLKPINLRKSEDDLYNREFLKKWKYKSWYVHDSIKKPYIFHDVLQPLHKHLVNRKCFKDAFIK
jgi:hypothetical protein